MTKAIIKKTTKLTSLIKMIGLNTIHPFTEKPSAENSEVPPATAPPMDANMRATELFSQFTANIIQERTVFTR